MRTARAAAIGTELGQRLEQARGVVVDEVAEHVEVLAVAVERGELDGGDHAEAVSRARLQRLVDAVHRVMVGERQQLHARVGGGRDHIARGGSAPSEHVECDCRSNAGAPIARP